MVKYYRELDHYKCQLYLMGLEDDIHFFNKEGEFVTCKKL